MTQYFTRYGRRLPIPSTLQVLHDLRAVVLKKDVKAPQTAQRDE